MYVRLCDKYLVNRNETKKKRHQLVASIFTPYVLNMQKDKHPPPQTSKKKEKVFLFVKNESYNVTGHSATPTAKALVKMLEETDTKVSTVYPQVNKSCIDIY